MKVKIVDNYSLLEHNTFHIDVKAKRFVEYNSVKQLEEVLAKGLVDDKFIHIGGGSNLLFLSDFDGTILHSAINSIERVYEDDEEVVLKVGSGVVWDELVVYAVENKLYGIENLSLIPGEVGAAAVQNIGAYGAEVKDYIIKVEALSLSGEARIFTKEECQYEYRDSFFKHNKNYILTYVYLSLSKKERYLTKYGAILDEVRRIGELNIENVRTAIVNIRESKLPSPSEIGNAGSFFKNPIVDREKYNELFAKFPEMPHYDIEGGRVKLSAGWMIDHAGWKGWQMGKVGVHPKQALIITNLGGAKGEDIKVFSEAIQADIKEKFGVLLEPEVNFIL